MATDVFGRTAVLPTERLLRGKSCRLRAGCKLFSRSRSQDDDRWLFKVDADRAGNLPALSAIVCDKTAPVMRFGSTGRELLMMRWGFQSPPDVGGPPVTDVLNVASPYWRPWLKPEQRCLVPVPLTSVEEWATLLEAPAD